MPERKRYWNFTKNRKIHGESNVRGTAQRQKKIYGFDVLVVFEYKHRSDSYGNCVRWHGNVLRREDGHVLKRALEVEGQREKGRPKRTWKKQAVEESVKVGLRMEDALCRSKWSVGVN